MEILKDHIESLKATTQKKDIIETLQEINKTILTSYRVKIEDGFYLYPTEVEAYYLNKENFNDGCVHDNPLQKNRFGKLYLHRRQKTGDVSAIINNKRGGIDICLSDDDNYAFGILIRSARIDSQKTICGPGRLFNFLSGIYGTELLSERIENNALLEKSDDESDPRTKAEIVVASREGIKRGGYEEEMLRSFIEFNNNTNLKGKKENIVRSYLEYCGENVTETRIVQLLGYRSKQLKEHFNI